MEYITIQSLEDRLEDYKVLDNSLLYQKIMTNLQDGLGPHQVVIECDLSPNSQLAERTIRKALLKKVHQKHIVDDIMTTYYRLLYFQLTYEGEKYLKSVANSETNFNYRTGKKEYIIGLLSSLENFTYKLVVNLIPLSVLLNYFPNSGNAAKLADIFSTVETENLKMKDFRDRFGLGGIYEIFADNFVTNQLEKMKVTIKDGKLIDVRTGKEITFLDE